MPGPMVRPEELDSATAIEFRAAVLSETVRSTAATLSRKAWISVSMVTRRRSCSDSAALFLSAWMRSVMSSCVPIQYLPFWIGRLTTRTARPLGVSTIRFITAPSRTAVMISARYFSGSILRLPVVMRFWINSISVQPGFTTPDDNPYIST